jgi:hypothetical protein
MMVLRFVKFAVYLAKFYISKTEVTNAKELIYQPTICMAKVFRLGLSGTRWEEWKYLLMAYKSEG